MKNLEKLLNSEQLAQLISAINENKDFSFDQNGLTVQSKANDGSLQLTIKYDATKNEQVLVEQEREKFLNMCKEIDDNLFVDICENTNDELLSKIQKAINSNNLESVRAAANRFKYECQTFIVNKINYYKECLHKLDK